MTHTFGIGMTIWASIHNLLYKKCSKTVFKTVHGYLDSVVRLFVHNRDVAPAQSSYNLDHGLHLMMVGRNRPRKVFEPLLVTQLRAGREEGHLESKTKK